MAETDFREPSVCERLISTVKYISDRGKRKYIMYIYVPTSLVTCFKFLPCIVWSRH